MSENENLNHQIKLNEEMISNLKEFFGSYLSDFLKEYRNKKEDDLKIHQVLEHQDKIYDKFHNLMKEKTLTASTGNLENHAKKQQQVIVVIKKFFSSNSKFIKLYRQGSKDYEKMNKLLIEQELIFEKLSKLMSQEKS
ncbi:MAG: hypothetical protein GWN01_08545 [Nitrosopumilaceae archaeon]|nr:hypothetical protein [Nitrosopumilaceae archaeon]NIU00963.1 hypothetical protein [Nitrosopumilaceae archaeon]NIU87421.1 hypothetical protein [Nitrosopumilaceae archaeon]NIV65943.1 hypothetical protein [Nitrosopumilaceae archaeon]NIX61565.1 hypothetical protein [Nitrosopumilaceae archaeon]